MHWLIWYQPAQIDTSQFTRDYQDERSESTCERVSLLDAARELGMNPQGLREYMKRGLIDIGLVLPNSKGTGFRYIIMREKLNRILGKEREGVFYGSEKDRQAL